MDFKFRHLPITRHEDTTAVLEQLQPIISGLIPTGGTNTSLASNVSAVEAKIAALEAGKLAVPVAPTKPTRALGTVYQPNTSRPTLVVATFRFEVNANTATVQVKVDATATPTVILEEPLLNSTGSVISQIPVTFEVPTGFRYLFTNASSGGAASLVSVYEYAR